MHSVSRQQPVRAASTDGAGASSLLFLLVEDCTCHTLKINDKSNDAEQRKSPSEGESLYADANSNALIAFACYATKGRN